MSQPNKKEQVTKQDKPVWGDCKCFCHNDECCKTPDCSCSMCYKNHLSKSKKTTQQAVEKTKEIKEKVADIFYDNTIPETETIDKLLSLIDEEKGEWLNEVIGILHTQHDSIEDYSDAEYRANYMSNSVLKIHNKTIVTNSQEK